jgi:L-threonylcarbamoyladenylate synthase
VAAVTAPVLEPTDENVARVADCIREGGVVVAPSDTNLGLALDPWDPAAVRRAYEIKDRPAHKPLTLFVRDPGDWRRFASHENPAVVDALAEEFWPGPLNLVLERDGRESVFYIYLMLPTIPYV